jgi:lambda family phage portal protein
VLNRLRRDLARWIAPAKKTSSRAYAGARNSRLTAGFGSPANTSADSELSMALTGLRSRSRQLMRDAPYANRARVIVVNNVIGSGVGMQAQVRNTRDELHARINADIEECWCEWAKADNCHTGGALSFQDFERACLSEVFVAGEVFIRKHRSKFGNSDIPLALELIEAERMADEFTFPAGASPNTRLGIELDRFGRPQNYWIREIHPGELRMSAEQTIRFEKVPASDIIHLRKVERWPQTRGEPWLHAVLRKLNDMDEYSNAELVAARMSANYFATIESPNEDPLATDTQEDGSKEMNIEPGVIEQLSPGDELKFHAPNRPNTSIDPFLRYMLREVAAGLGVSYESLSRDYSQSNYSSSRLSLLDDRDLWRVLQQWWVRSFREPLLKDWMQAAVLSREIASIPVDAFLLDTERYLSVTWKLRGWSWVDPTKEVEAYKEAIRAGLTSATRVIAMTADGADIEDIIEERKRELEMYDEAEVEVDTTVPEPVEPVEPADAGQPAAAAAPAGDGAGNEDTQPDTEDAPAAPARVVKMRMNA